MRAANSSPQRRAGRSICRAAQRVVLLAAGAIAYPAPAADDEARLSNGLFPLSPHYPMCLEAIHVLRSSIRNGTYGYASVVDLTAEGADLGLEVGSFMLDPGSTVSELPRSPSGARVQTVRSGASSSLLVSDIPEAGNGRVGIQYEAGNRDAFRAALTVANHVVACRIEVRGR